MENIFDRNRLILGAEKQSLLAQKHIAVFGVGGVGGFALESLVRCGIGEVSIIDFDKVSLTNINRQIIALNSTVGDKKTEIFKQRLYDINPQIKLNIFDDFYTEKLNSFIFNKQIDFVVDAIDTMHSKIQLLKYCYETKIPVITSLGAANRIDPTKLYIADISEVTPSCNFSKNILKQLAKYNILKGITAVASSEKPVKIEKKLSTITTDNCQEIKKIQVGSLPFTPAVAGYYMGYFVVKRITE